VITPGKKWICAFPFVSEKGQQPNMNKFGGLQVKLPAFLTSELDKGNSFTLRPLCPDKSTLTTQWIGDQGSTRTDLDVVVNKRNNCIWRETNPICSSHNYTQGVERNRLTLAAVIATNIFVKGMARRQKWNIGKYTAQE
jgi:hypothetical protein